MIELPNLSKVGFGGYRCHSLLKYFDAEVNNGVVKYDYILKDGISNQRLGSQLIKNEKILEILSEIVKREKETN